MVGVIEGVEKRCNPDGYAAPCSQVRSILAVATFGRVGARGWTARTQFRPRFDTKVVMTDVFETFTVNMVSE